MRKYLKESIVNFIRNFLCDTQGVEYQYLDTKMLIRSNQYF